MGNIKEQNMPAIFKKIKVKAKTGRGEGTDGMLEEFIGNHDATKEAFDGLSAEEQQEVVDRFNTCLVGLGDAFKTSKNEFECNALDIMNHQNFFEMLTELGFDI